MSHVETMGLHVLDLKDLAEAGLQCGGLILMEKKNYRWYGHHVGDYPRPVGFTAADDGKCEYVLTDPTNPNMYEVGIAKRKDGKPGYELLYDFFAGGYGLMAKIGEKGARLKQEYAIAAATRRAKLEGRKVTRTVNQKTGRPQLVMVR